MALRGSATAQKILQVSSRSFSSALTGNNGNSIDNSRVSQKGNLHITAKNQYPVAAALPLPNNIDPSESTRFSPQRNREISAASIVSHELNLAKTIDITVDNSKSYSAPTIAFNDPHLKSYDSNGAISISAVMQTSVPNPFGGMHKFSHLNMPGGQWSQEGKFMSQSLHDSHYTNLRRDARSDWSSYDQNATVPKGTTSCHLLNSKNVNQFLTKSSLFGSLSNSNHSLLHVSSYSTQGKETASSEASAPPVILTKREQLKRAFKDYGATIVVFHVGISLISLECFYLLVSGGIDVMPFVEAVGLGSSALSNKIAAGASTFVIAYAIHKVFAPIRISITLAATPLIVRFLRKRGWLAVKKSSTEVSKK